MVSGCPKSEDGEHFGIDGKLIKYSIRDISVIAHFIGTCEHCGCTIHFTCRLFPRDEFEPDTLEEEHLDGYKEVYVDE